jgi:DNA polymerase-3 subunit alpha
MRKHITQLLPNSISELTAMVALYRPGPYEHITAYIEGKFGKRKPNYLDERMEPILRETYGVITYQDQVLQIVQALAGFSLARADVLRRAMGKKDKALLDSMKIEFILGTSANGISPETAEKIWVLLEPFAGYAFNKAHAVCYALIAYQTAYLKANYPVEYFAGLLGAYRDSGRIIGMIEECRRLGIRLLPPDVNRSMTEFTVEGSDIRFGLGAIKGIGDAAIEMLLKAREKGPFTHLFDLAVRTKEFGALNKPAIEALIKAGALDSIDDNRNKHLNVLDTAMAYAESAQRERTSGQTSMFGDPVQATGRAYPNLPFVEPPTAQEKLAMEREVLGLFISDHPLRQYERLLESRGVHNAASLPNLKDGANATIAGLIAAVREMRTKQKNEKMAVLTIEDFSGQALVTVFPKAYEAMKDLIMEGALVAVRGTIKHRERGVELISRSIENLCPQKLERPHLVDEPAPGRIVVRISRASLDELKSAQELMRNNPGEFELLFEVAKNGNAEKGAAWRFNLPFRVSDGPWLHRLRTTFYGSFLQVNRNAPVA